VDPALILILVLGLSVLVFIAFAILMFRSVTVPPTELEAERVPADADAPEQDPDRRPWRARHSAWLLVAVLFLILALFVAPKLFGGVLFFLPLFWFRGPRRRRPHSPNQ
jgi:hypothetical protein